MIKTKAICIAALVAFAGAGHASAGLLGIGGQNGNITVAPSIGLGPVLSGNNGNNILNGVGVLTGNLNGTLNGVLNGNGILNTNGGSDCGCKKSKRH
ncbi:MAG: hypothetical protein BGO05_19435 [Rhizobiales bacterium 63-7]|uniref:hypothetical protein n=1 Tax=Rhizobium sp. YJ-22 TaxID=3037556 RepID=UPI0009263B8A|nr:hypothetical protein [Rhizobium sp. YJ-22]MBN9029919.1 hypothetical protein [Hyphomicrobiales bacterium]MDG3577869.1 hypothetical protein [Rhizobium sp. YJ-22]OJU72110.1 MAG: hypothetical protein BGO05_19435 [Rhizobiales bacterium 63-7]